MDEAEKVRLVRKVDAKSRFIIKAINLANSYRIAQLGPMAHDELRGGFIMGNGGAGISRDAGCVRFPPHPDQTMLQTRDASIPTQFNMLPERFNGFLRRIAPQLMTISPYDLPEIYTRVTGQSDFLFLSRSLKWDKENVDNISTGLFVRSIAENITPNPSDWMFLPISDHLGLLRTDVLAYGAIFTGKTFKFTRGLNHEEFWLLFEPKHPGVSLLGPPRVPGGPFMLDTDLDAICNGISPAHAWLNASGNLKDLDMTLFYGYLVQLLWGGERSRKQFELYLRFIARARAQGISADIVTCNGKMTETLDLSAVIAHAYNFGLKVPDALKETAYIDSSFPEANFIPRDIPCFWSDGSCVFFYANGHRAILKNLVTAFCKSSSSNTQDVAPLSLDIGTCEQNGSKQFHFPSKKVWILYPPVAQARINKLVREAKVAVPRVTSAILQEKDALKRKLCQNSVEVLFIFCAEEMPLKELIAVLDMCERMQVVTGVFSGMETVMDNSVMELVSRHFATNEDEDDDAVFVRDMVSGTVKKYEFKGDGWVSVTDSDEESITKRKA